MPPPPEARQISCKSMRSVHSLALGLISRPALPTSEHKPPEARHDRFRYPRDHGVDLARLRACRLGRVRDKLAARDIAACLLFHPINIRYATDTTNMQVWTLHNPALSSLQP